jgi:hypothetical protein
MTDYKCPITINRRIPYADNLAHAINEYWREQVAIPDGTRSAYEGNVFMPHTNGIPNRIKKFGHPAIIRIRIVGKNRWMIVDQEK